LLKFCISWENTDIVPLDQNRPVATGVALDAFKALITGGPGKDTSELLGLNPSGLVEKLEFVAGPTLPDQIYNHCAVKVGDEHVFISGGIQCEIINVQVWLLINYSLNRGDLDANVNQWNSWFINLNNGRETLLSQIPPEEGADRMKLFCGLSQDRNGEHLIVVGGGYSFQDGTR